MRVMNQLGHYVRLRKKGKEHPLYKEPFQFRFLSLFKSWRTYLSVILNLLAISTCFKPRSCKAFTLFIVSCFFACLGVKLSSLRLFSLPRLLFLSYFSRRETIV